MQTFTPDTFVKNYLPSVLANTEQLAAHFVTYNSVQGYGAGPVATGDRNLSITVHGAYEISVKEAIEGLAAMFSGNSLLANENHRAYIQRKHANLQQVKKDLEESGPKPGMNAKLVFVIYAGLTAYEGSVANALELRKAFPGAEIVLLTCDCRLTSKLASMHPKVESGVINAVIVARICGGCDEMGEVLNGFLETWRERMLVPA